MKTSCHGRSVVAFSSLCAISVLLVLTLSGRFSSFTTFSALQESEIPAAPPETASQDVAATALAPEQTTVKSTDHERAVDASGNSSTATREKKNNNTLSKEQKLEQGLAAARASIGLAISSDHDRNDSDIFVSDVYRNPRAFHQSYTEMERRFKVFVYPEGELPIMHDGPCKEIYAVEGRFIQDLEQGNLGSKFKTSDPSQAHVFFLPFSVAWMVKYVYQGGNFHEDPFINVVSDYVRTVSTRYPFWNRTQGADHFMLSCHDWGPDISKASALLYNNSIRVLCNANTSEGFNPQKDVSLPEIHLPSGQMPAKLSTPPPLNARRPYLAFFSGGVHGPIRPILLQHWKGKDKDMQVHEYLPKGKSYNKFLRRSKYCLCPSGYEVASPRVPEAIYAGCVPVILSESYVLPFSDVLRWEAFSIKVETLEIPRLKEILLSVPEEKYGKLREGLRKVREHFVVNQPAKRFDVFHMTLHSIWLRRINLRLA